MEKAKRNKMLAKEAVRALLSCGFEAWYCETKEAARQKCLELMPKGSSIGWGGSRTLDEIGIWSAVKNGDYTLFDRDAAKDPQEKRLAELAAFDADFFLMSSNAVGLDGTLVNIDGVGNRAAALIYGPRNVLIVAGVNKLTADGDEAFARARSVAAPLNAIRLNKKTPCAATGLCEDCTSDGCICRHLVVTRMSNGQGRIKLIIVGEELGF